MPWRNDISRNSSIPAPFFAAKVIEQGCWLKDSRHEQLKPKEKNVNIQWWEIYCIVCAYLKYVIKQF